MKNKYRDRRYNYCLIHSCKLHHCNCPIGILNKNERKARQAKKKLTKKAQRRNRK